MVTNPSARLNAVTDPDPFPIGYAARPRGPSTRLISRYSVLPRSEFTRTGIRAVAVVVVSAGRPPSRRITGATNSWNVKMADVGKPGRITTGTGRRSAATRATARQIG